MGDLQAGENFPVRCRLIVIATGAPATGLIDVTCTIIDDSRNRSAGTVAEMSDGWYECTDFTPDAGGNWVTEWSKTANPENYTFQQTSLQFKVGGGEVTDIKTDTADIHTDVGTAIAAIGDVHATDLPALKTVVDDIHNTDLPALKTVVDNLHDTDLPDVHTDVAAVKSETAAIKAKTDLIVSGGATEANVDAVETKVDTVDTVVDAIKVMTDKVGTIVNTGGVATLGAVIGDVANSTLVAKIVAIPTTAMRGTDSAMLAASYVTERGTDNALLAANYVTERGTDNAALASVCTEARLAELAAANLPANIDTIVADVAAVHVHVAAIPTTAMRGTDNALLAASYVTERGTDGAALASSWTATRAGYIDYLASATYGLDAIHTDVADVHTDVGTIYTFLSTYIDQLLKTTSSPTFAGLTFNPAAVAIIINSFATSNNGSNSMPLWFARASPTTAWNGITFRGAVAYDMGIYIKPSDDSIYIGTWGGGGGFVDQFKINAIGLTLAGALTALTGVFAGNTGVAYQGTLQVYNTAVSSTNLDLLIASHSGAIAGGYTSLQITRSADQNGVINIDAFLSAVGGATLNLNTLNRGGVVIGSGGLTVAGSIKIPDLSNALNFNDQAWIYRGTAQGDLRFVSAYSGANGGFRWYNSTTTLAMTLDGSGNLALVGALTATQGTFNIADGTAPLVITSTTLVSHLNADLWDGYQFSDYLDQAVKQASSPTFSVVQAGYKSSDGTVGDSDSVTVMGSDGATLTTLNFKNGLYTGYSSY